MSAEVVNDSLLSACRLGHLQKVRDILSHHNLSDYLPWSNGYVPLRIALENQRIEVAKLLLQHGAKVNSKTNTLRKNSDTPLHFAACTNDIDLVTTLLLKGAVVGAKNKRKQTPLHLAVVNEKAEVVQILLNYGAYVKERDSENEEPLHLAAKNRDVKIAKLLLSYGANVNSVVYNSLYSSNFTALYCATKYKNVEMVKLFLQNGADVNFLYYVGNGNSNTVLHLAIEDECENIISILIQNGADVNCTRFCKHKNEQVTALYLAVERNNYCITQLLQNGAKINSSFDSNSRLLHLAIRRGSEEIVKLLLKDNNELEGEEEDGFTVLHTAVKERKAEILKLLLEKGCSVNTVTKSGVTPLHTAAEKGVEQIVQLLLNHNANVNAKDSKGLSVLHKAAEQSNENIVKLLLDNGSVINDTSLTMTTPLQVAVQNKQECIVELLLERGADVNAKDEYNNTALYYAVEKSNMKILGSLLRFKPDVENESNKSALRLAILQEAGSIPEVIPSKSEVISLILDSFRMQLGMSITGMVNQLLNYGFTVSSKDINDSELFHASVSGGYTTVVQNLLERGSNVERTVTTLNIASMKKRREIIEMLLNHGFPASSEKPLRRMPLYFACRDQDLDMCRLLLAKGANIDSKIYDDDSFLHIAVQQKDEKLVEFAFNQGANVNSIGNDNSTPLHIACKNGCAQIVKLLLKHNANVNMKDRNGFTPLHKAIKKKNYRGMLLLLKTKSIDVNVSTNSMSTPLHFAVKYGCDVRLLVCLLKLRADINAKDSNNKTALHCAVLSNNYCAICILLDEDPDVNNKNNKLAFCLAITETDNPLAINVFLNRGFIIKPEDFNDFQIPKPLLLKLEKDLSYNEVPTILQALLKREATPQALFEFQVLKACVTKGYVKVLRHLLNQDMNINASLDKGRTLLHYAIENKKHSVVVELLKHGANVNAVDSFNTTPLHQSVRYHAEEIVALLLKFGADVEARDIDADTSLHIAIRCNMYRNAQLLLDAEADINSANKEGLRPLHVAAVDDCEYGVKLLLYYDAEIDVKNKNNETPLDLALARYNMNIVKFLLENGATHIVEKKSPYCYCPNISELVKKYEIKMETAKMNNVEIDVYPKMDIFRTECKEELKRMKYENICYNISLFDVLTKNDSVLARYVRNESVIKILDASEYEARFPIYANILKIRISKAEKRNRLIDLGGLCLESILEIKLPELVIEKLFSYVNNLDLRNLIHAAPINREEKSLSSINDLDLGLVTNFGSRIILHEF